MIERHRKYGEHVERLDIILLSPRGYETYAISDHVTTYPTNSSSKAMRIFDAIRLAKKMAMQTKYDLVIAMDPFFTGLVATKVKKLGVKFLVHFHGDFWGGHLNPVLKMLSRYVVNRADAVRVMSEGQRGSLVKSGISIEKIRVISTPVDLGKYSEYNVENPEAKIVLHVGRDDAVKDYNTLIKAFKIIDQKKPDDVIFWQTGGSKELEKTMKNNDFRRVAMLHFKSHEDLVPLYNQASVIVLSSRSESFGKVLVEANACGKPVVSTATTGAQEIIQDGYNGFLVPIGDANALAEKILYLLDNPDQSKAIGENGRKLVHKKFSNNTEKIINYWREIVR